MKNKFKKLKTYIKIPDSIWKNRTGKPKDDLRLPDGEYRFTIKPPLGASVMFDFLQSFKGKSIPVEDSHLLIMDLKQIGENDEFIQIEFEAGFPPLVILAGTFVGLGLSAYILHSIEKIIYLLVPLLIVGTLLYFPVTRKPILNKIKRFIK